MLILVESLQLYEIVNLVNELLPPMPDTQGVHAASSSNGALSSRGPGITIASKVEDGQGVVGTGKESIGDTVLRQQTLKRLKKFSEVALPANSGISGELTPLTLLVRKLQDALASLEGFPVRFSHAPRTSSSSASISNGMNALTQPFKLRLCRSSGEKMLRDYSTNIVLIEPLARYFKVDIIWWKVYLVLADVKIVPWTVILSKADILKVWSF